MKLLLAISIGLFALNARAAISVDNFVELWAEQFALRLQSGSDFKDVGDARISWGVSIASLRANPLSIKREDYLRVAQVLGASPVYLYDYEQIQRRFGIEVAAQSSELARLPAGIRAIFMTAMNHEPEQYARMMILRKSFPALVTQYEWEADDYVYTAGPARTEFTADQKFVRYLLGLQKNFLLDAAVAAKSKILTQPEVKAFLTKRGIASVGDFARWAKDLSLPVEDLLRAEFVIAHFGEERISARDRMRRFGVNTAEILDFAWTHARLPHGITKFSIADAEQLENNMVFKLRLHDASSEQPDVPAFIQSWRTDFSLRLRFAMGRAELSSIEAAELIKTQQSRVSKMTTGLQLPTLEQARQLSERLNVDLNWMVGVDQIRAAFKDSSEHEVLRKTGRATRELMAYALSPAGVDAEQVPVGYVKPSCERLLVDASLDEIRTVLAQRGLSFEILPRK